MSDILIFIGTRPELIKIAPVVLELNKRGLRKKYTLVNTAQHKDLLDPYWNIFDIRPDQVLDVMFENSNLSTLSARCLIQMQEYLDTQKCNPKIILAQGDTTTVMISSIISFYNKIKFVHLEAGLRSFDFNNPFPEEFNRRIASISCFLHLAPTKIAKENLIREGHDRSKITIVGNTVVDSLQLIKTKDVFNNNIWLNDLCNKFPGKKFILITCHRRENQGEGLKNIVTAIRELALQYTEYLFIWPIHPNPKVREVIGSSNFGESNNILIIEPLSYFNLLALLKVSSVVISDSGGIQEEAPSFNVPVLVLREKTERPEGIDSGIAFLVGSDTNAITEKFRSVINMKFGVMNNPYGDGRSASRIVDLLERELNN